ncbi:MAG TPA: nuclear transport factor 2 family protein [Stellaceae bacterium]|nr:nuclear transport factor 2 family protein [Stellaceae bacterium]
MIRILSALLLLGFTASPALAATQEQMEANKKTVWSLYDAAFNKKDMALARTFMGPHYKQHNPMAKDDIEGLAGFVAYLKSKSPDFKVELLREFADGDYVITHVWGHNGPNDRGFIAMDIFRLDNGKVVEHWDSVQPIPEKTMNANGMK